MQSNTVTDLIATAIRKEEEAYFYYLDIHDAVADDQARETIMWIAGEERKHRQFLIDYRDGKLGDATLRMTTPVDYKVAEHLVEPEVDDQTQSADVYLIAAHRELKAHQFYLELAKLHPEGGPRDILMKMAAEELKHKEKMEYLYSNTAFTQTSGG